MVATKFVRTSKKTGANQQPANPLFEARSKLEQAERLRREGNLVQAQNLCESLLKRYPDYVGALHTIGLILADRKMYRQAQAALSEAANLSPSDWIVLTALSTVQLQIGANEMAARTLEQAIARNPDDATVHATLGEVYKEEREYELAVEAFSRATKLDPELSSSWLGLGMALIQLGRLKDAATALEKVVMKETEAVNTLYSLSQLPRHLVTIDVLELLKHVKRLPQRDPKDFEISRAFAKASALMAQARHSEAWSCLDAVNRERFDEVRDKYLNDKPVRDKFLGRADQSEVLTDIGELDDRYPVSLFIFGPSRSGKTSVELLASTLDSVKRGYENPILRNTARRSSQLAGLPTRNVLAELPMGLNDLCREQYLRELGDRAGSAKVFTNTHPGRIFDCYRIAAMFPNVRFIFVKRDVNDIVFRMYTKLYNSGNYYSYDISAAREYVEWYYNVLDALAVLMPTISMTLNYEDLITDPTTARDAIAEFCGLPKSTNALQMIGDDRGCAGPYIEYMDKAATA